MIKRLFLVLFLVLGLLFPLSTGWAATQSIDDLARAYEVWKGKGIKFVIRDAEGQFSTWGVGRLESWNNESTWVVRDPRGRFLTNAVGRVETWKNGMTRLVLRDKKGHLLTHINIDLTSRASFSRNVVGLRRISGDHRFLAFVQETLTELLIKELKLGDKVRTAVLFKYLRAHLSDSGMENFRPVLKATSQQLNFLAAQNGNPEWKKLAEEARKLLKEI